MQSSTLEFQTFDMESPEEEEEILSKGNRGKLPPFSSSSAQEGYPDLSAERTPKESNKSFWTFEYYQQFFDVNTEEVKSRIIWAMLPRPGRNYLEHCIKPNPDLYGPFWICTTLIFTIAVSGNVANYLQYAQNGPYAWKYDFHLISTAAFVIFSYAFFLPLGLWTFIKWTTPNATLSFLELVCLYGYSLAIYVPVSVLWVIQISWIQWSLVLIGATMSAIVLISTLGPSIEGGRKIPVLGVVISLHFLLAIGFMEIFFYVPDVILPVVITEAPHAIKALNNTVLNKT